MLLPDAMLVLSWQGEQPSQMLQAGASPAHVPDISVHEAQQRRCSLDSCLAQMHRQRTSAGCTVRTLLLMLCVLLLCCAPSGHCLYARLLSGFNLSPQHACHAWPCRMVRPGQRHQVTNDLACLPARRPVVLLHAPAALRLERPRSGS